MAENSKIPFKQMDKFVGMFSLNNPSNIMLKSDYEKMAKVLVNVDYETKQLLDKMSYSHLQESKFAQNPIMGLSEQQRNHVLKNLQGFAADHDLFAVWKDMKAGNAGYKTPVYNVNGHPVRAELFDKEGVLDKNVAKIYGVYKAPEPAANAAVNMTRPAVKAFSPK